MEISGQRDLRQITSIFSICRSRAGGNPVWFVFAYLTGYKPQIDIKNWTRRPRESGDPWNCRLHMDSRFRGNDEPGAIWGS